MDTMMFTHNLNKKCVRRFFVNPSMRDLIHELEAEIQRFPYKEVSMSHYYEYIKIRVLTLPLFKYNDFIDTAILEAQLLDCADVYWWRFCGLKPPSALPNRMYKYSEILPINKERGNNV